VSAIATERFASFDGVELAIHRLGEGRPVVLLHGLFSDARTNWIRFGHARRLADAGFAAIMPDLRAHGESAKPHDPRAYPEDVLVKDAQALVQHLGLRDYDLGGFSLGARTAARGVIEGLAPRRLVLAGMGLEGLAGWARRSAFFIDAIDRVDEVKHGDQAFFAVAFIKTQKVDRIAARLLLQSVGDTEASELSAITMPTLVVCGDKDRDNGSPEALVGALSDGRFEEVPGTHMSSVTEAALGEAIARFLSE
jgi:pimeloyl-ACP methyl ester carboxylesterase